MIICCGVISFSYNFIYFLRQCFYIRYSVEMFLFATYKYIAGSCCLICFILQLVGLPFIRYLQKLFSFNNFLTMIISLLWNHCKFLNNADFLSNWMIEIKVYNPVKTSWFSVSICNQFAVNFYYLEIQEWYSYCVIFFTFPQCNFIL